MLRIISYVSLAIYWSWTAAVSVAVAQGQLRPAELKCEYAVDPLGIDIPNPRLYWIVTSDQRGQKQTAYQILAASTLELLARDRADLWDSGRRPSEQTLHIRYEGKPLESSQQVFWKVRVWDAQGEPSAWSESATWTTGVLDEHDWRALWIVAPWQTEGLLLRKEFAVRPGLERALVHVSGVGQFELFLNGGKVGENLLSPGWTMYNRTCLYETHDVTDQLTPGVNTVGVSLGDGMYHTERRNRFSKFQGSFGPNRVFGQIELQYADGTREIVGTDETWKVDPGPVTFNDIFGGEDYDARRLPVGWSKSDFDDTGWTHAVELVRPSGRLRGATYSAPPLRAIETILPIATKPINDDTEVVDFGQNTSYMPRITVSGPAGSTVRLSHAEVLHDDGTINRDTCGGNRGDAYWLYTKRTDDAETWFPQFFYAGCRYLQVEKIPAAQGGTLPHLDRVEGVVVHSSAEPLGEFTCSSELVNRIRTLVRWAQRSNMVSVLTDCPHREKLGWLEQYHLNGPAIRYEFDVTRIFTKGMRDMADSQHDDGLIPNIAPEYVKFPGTFQRAAEWGCAFIFVPWQQYLFTGDTALMDEYYERMERYMGYLESIADDHIIDEGLGDWYDLDGIHRPGEARLTPPPITATAFYFYDAVLMSRIARKLHKRDDSARYATLSGDIRKAWLRKFHDQATGLYGTDSQCSNALALEMGLIEPQDRPVALERLVHDVQSRGNAMTAGDVGFRYLLQALAHGGRSDVIFDMINQDEKPGYGYQLKQGATSLTEAWDANHHASHNHFMLGHITEWFYKDLVGIDSKVESPGFKDIVIMPTPVGDLTWAEATFHSIRGPIAVRWDRSPEEFKLRVHIPANTTATVSVPAESSNLVTEGGIPAAQSRGVKFRRSEERYQVFDVESGDYEFISSH